MQTPEWRTRFLARLAAERSRLLWQYRSLSERTLSTLPVFDNYTPKDLLAHIGEWDIFHTERLGHILKGRNDLIFEIQGETFYPERNADLHKANQHRTLSQSIELLTAGRAGFLDALAAIPDEDLQQPRSLPWGEEITLASYITWRYKHDALHSESLSQWREFLPRETGPKVILRALFDVSFKEIATLVDLLPPEERETRKVIGHWNLRDAIGHLTDWETLAAEYVSLVLDGLPTSKMARWSEFSGDEWNAQFAFARRDQPFEDAWHDYANTRQQMLTLLSAATPDDLARTLIAPWGSELSLYEFFLDWPGHDREHAAMLRREILVEDSPEWLLKV